MDLHHFLPANTRPIIKFFLFAFLVSNFLISNSCGDFKGSKCTGGVGSRRVEILWDIPDGITPACTGDFRITLTRAPEPCGEGNLCEFLNIDTVVHLIAQPRKIDGLGIDGLGDVCIFETYLQILLTDSNLSCACCEIFVRVSNLTGDWMTNECRTIVDNSYLTGDDPQPGQNSLLRFTLYHEECNEDLPGFPGI